MAFQPCPETAELRLQAMLHGQIVENVWHCRISTAPDATEMADVLNMFKTWLLGPYALSNSNELTYTEAIVTDLNVASGLQVTEDLSGFGGEITSPVKSNQDTFAIKLSTGHRGRSFRGRTYVMAVATNLYDTPNTLSPTAVTTLVGNFTTFITDSGLAGHPIGVLSRFSKDANPIPPHERATGLLTDITEASATDNIIDSQNRRLPGRGI